LETIVPNQTREPKSASHSTAAAEPSTDGLGHHLYASVVATLVLAVICCGIYPLIVWGIARLPGLSWKADGSLLTDKQGNVVGSALLAQPFTSDKYFHERPSAAGNSDDSTQLTAYNAVNSQGTNLGPTSDKLINGIHGSKKADGTPDPASDYDGIKDLAREYREAEPGIKPDQPVPADAVTNSASGLDPHISVANARIQAVRVGRTRGIDEKKVDEYIEKYTEGPDLGILGDPGVNVLKLNLALDADFPAK
jgi:K+-transporting ATPase ATPase C chain